MGSPCSPLAARRPPSQVNAPLLPARGWQAGGPRWPDGERGVRRLSPAIACQARRCCQAPAARRLNWIATSPAAGMRLAPDCMGLPWQGMAAAAALPVPHQGQHQIVLANRLLAVRSANCKAGHQRCRSPRRVCCWAPDARLPLRLSGWNGLATHSTLLGTMPAVVPASAWVPRQCPALWVCSVSPSTRQLRAPCARWRRLAPATAWAARIAASSASVQFPSCLVLLGARSCACCACPAVQLARGSTAQGSRGLHTRRRHCPGCLACQWLSAQAPLLPQPKLAAAGLLAAGTASGAAAEPP